MSTTIAAELVERGASSLRLILALVRVAQFMINLDTMIVSVALTVTRTVRSPNLAAPGRFCNLDGWESN